MQTGNPLPGTSPMPSGDAHVKYIPYEYHNMPVPGGGYVTGIVFHPAEPGLLYIRTDIGGCYRFDRASERWISLIDHVTMEDLREAYPIALAVPPSDPDRLYIVCGIYDPSSHAKLCISDDRGETFRYVELPFYAHGNLGGRASGERLIVDPDAEEVLYYASQKNGFWISRDCGEHWEQDHAMKEQYLTFVSKTGPALLVGTAGVTTGSGTEPMTQKACDAAGTSAARAAAAMSTDLMRGHSLFVSYDGGTSFLPLNQPASHHIPGVYRNGQAAMRAACDDDYVYVTFESSGPGNYQKDLGYGCDGGQTADGRVLRYPIHRDGSLGDGTDITPEELLAGAANGCLPFGICGVSCAASWWDSGASCDARCREDSGSGYVTDHVQAFQGNLLAISTVSRQDGDSIYVSEDQGDTWTCVLHGLDTGVMDFRTPYMKPECNGGRNLIHWMSDLEINPFDADEAWFTTGTGIFRTENLTGRREQSVAAVLGRSDSEESGDIRKYPVHFSDWCDGLEETVHLGVYSMPEGPVIVLDVVGDLGGFAFTDLDRPCHNSFADAHDERYITTMNVDFPDNDCRYVVATPRGNWRGATKGGLIWSEDYGQHFRRIPMPFGLDPELDETMHQIEQPNVNAGWAALSADHKSIAWTLADGSFLPVTRLIVSNDGGESFFIPAVYDLSGRRIRGVESGQTAGAPEAVDGEQPSPQAENFGEVNHGGGQKHGIKVFSDRSDPSVFYGFGECGQIYLSEDRGHTFRQLESPLPAFQGAWIDCADPVEIRAEAGRKGVFYLALGQEGLWKLFVKKGRCSAEKLSPDGMIVYRAGLGIMPGAESFAGSPKAVYCNGVLQGVYGFYRSLDDGATWERINQGHQMFGDIICIDGDRRVPGRFYLATGSRGLIYGQEAR